MNNPSKAYSLRDIPSLIEHLFPTNKISAESQRERKSGGSQTLTGLGSYWKGRKPLFLVRSCILASLLPYTGDPKKGLYALEKLLCIDKESISKRFRKNTDLKSIEDGSYIEKIAQCYRPEEMDNTHLDAKDWNFINDYCGTDANSLETLVEQLSIMRYGHKVKVSDPFCGSGSIPFEASRLGCDVYASDLNPIACMLTWGAFNIVGASKERFTQIQEQCKIIISKVQKHVDDLNIEVGENGDQAKHYLYCLETRCPETGWMVPMLSNFLISNKKKIIVLLIPDHENKRYNFEVVSDASDSQMEDAKIGTVKDGHLIHPMNPNTLGVSLSDIRGEHKELNGVRTNNLRPWRKTDFIPHAQDIFQERLYCIEWIKKSSLGKSNQETFFVPPTPYDCEKEKVVENIVKDNIGEWQHQGLIPDMAIENGKKTIEPKRMRGWMYWHHLFMPRQLLICSLILKEINNIQSPEATLLFARLINGFSKLCIWSPITESVSQTFFLPILNPIVNYGMRSFYSLKELFKVKVKNYPLKTDYEIHNIPANSLTSSADIYITSPLYADAVYYHEITEFFIAWLRKNPPSPFHQWIWDSRRSLAIQGDGYEFRTQMIEAYSKMADLMPDNGLQIVMFTHKSGKVWADMVQIFWWSGLQVVALWYIATEITSERTKGAYVQGSQIIILRKRKAEMSGYSDEIIQEIKHEISQQLETMTALNKGLRGDGRVENLYEDVDLQMSGYASTLKVLTQYTNIDGKCMVTEALNPQNGKYKTLVDELIEYSVHIANEFLVPEGMSFQTWEKRNGVERFYLKMLDLESKGNEKLDNYQNFAKSFRVSDYQGLMVDVKSDSARLKNASDFDGKMLDDKDQFGHSLTRFILFAIWELEKKVEEPLVLRHLKDNVENYTENREDLQNIAQYIGLKREELNPTESQNAHILAQRIKDERIG